LVEVSVRLAAGGMYAGGMYAEPSTLTEEVRLQLAAKPVLAADFLVSCFSMTEEKHHNPYATGMASVIHNTCSF
jgi:hypothetical protein